MQQIDQPEDDEIIIKVNGLMVTALAAIDTMVYKDNIQIFRNGNKVLYGKAKKAIYDTARTTYLFCWLDLSGSLKKWGFNVNPYDRPCTTNHMFGRINHVQSNST